jgi:hypothetical protein
MFETIPILAFMNFTLTELIFSPFLWLPINIWRLFGPAQIAIAAIFGAIGFVWIIVLPYLSWRLIKYIAKNKVQGS